MKPFQSKRDNQSKFPVTKKCIWKWCYHHWMNSSEKKKIRCVIQIITNSIWLHLCCCYWICIPNNFTGVVWHSWKTVDDEILAFHSWNSSVWGNLQLNSVCEAFKNWHLTTLLKNKNNFIIFHSPKKKIVFTALPKKKTDDLYSPADSVGKNFWINGNSCAPKTVLHWKCNIFYSHWWLRYTTSHGYSILATRIKQKKKCSRGSKIIMNSFGVSVYKRVPALIKLDVLRGARSRWFLSIAVNIYFMFLSSINDLWQQIYDDVTLYER